MRIFSLKTLKVFWTNYPDSEINLLHWYGKIARQDYQSPNHVIQNFKGADYVGNERIVFNICHNKYRLIAAFNYEYQICFIKFIGTHKEYDKVDARTIEY
ncbi:type II toxin-antitoxin system HigB family toxin [Dyadobacter sandarakinus]|uniref:Type II toxin-antitoxin system HigB family toxin n=1 Tax=Dyadobacter sandarakinus TaxID=2747268 RepID=A0ABX7ICE3_9BACT|nr:type II toxin-antitoxin system HigB family toxin [Dyadobacter sandarakinus]QRR03784.1 type II toxin-antitoxin system HigB family toxin [Dyadobacter sandarakinus]